MELKGNSFKIFNDMEMSFLTHYQFPIWYEIGIELLNSLHQDNATHIFDHIHEWQRRHKMTKNQILDKILMDWFTMSLIPPITRYVAMARVTTEEQSILHTKPKNTCRWCGRFCSTCLYELVSLLDGSNVH